MSKKRTLMVLAAVVSVVAVGGATAVYASGHGASKGGVAGLSAPSAPQSSISITNAKLPKTDFITNDSTGLGTTSTTYVAVPGMTKSISLAGTAPSAVVVEVSAFAFAQGAGKLEFVSVTLDGAQGNPSETQFAAEDGTFAVAHAALFAFPGVSPGSHSVAMVFKSFDGTTVFVHRPAMDIRHK